MTRSAALGRAGVDAAWYRIENLDTGAEVFLYNEIGTYGITADAFVSDLRAIKSPTIDLHVNSPGGDVFDGMAIYAGLRNHPAKVTVHIDGVAASAASFIAMAGDRILAERTATMMIHDGMGIAAGNSADMKKLAALLDQCSDNIASVYAERAGGTVEQWRDRMRAETWYTAEEAKAAGLVDEVVGTRSRTPTNLAQWDLSLFTYAGRDKAPDPFAPTNHAPDPPPEEPEPENPPDEAGFLIPPLDLGRIRDAVESLDDIPFKPGLITAAIALGANDCPAPDQPAPAVPQDLGPDLSINLPGLRRAIREAQL